MLATYNWHHQLLDNSQRIMEAVEIWELFGGHAGYGVSRINALKFMLFIIGRYLQPISQLLASVEAKQLPLS